jgi:putative ABC transport system permease protein
LGAAVTANLIPTLGVRPLLGRMFTADEERPETRAIVLSYRLWQRRYGGDPNLVGNAVTMNGLAYTVIGVMPKGFQFPDRQTELWQPLGLSPLLLARRNSHFLKVVGRLKPDRTVRQAQSEMSAVAAQLAKEFPASNARVAITLVPLKDQVLGDTRTAFVILLSAAGCVLLIACANVGNLLLARATRRQREMAIRTALGAAPMRLLRQVAVENLILASAGGALGLLFAHWGVRLLERMIPEALAGSIELGLDSRVVTFTAAVSILTGLLFGLAPAVQLARVNLSSRAAVGHAGRRLRDALVVAEVAIALVLVVGATLLIETIARLRAVDAGFQSSGILTADIPVPYPKYQDVGKRQRFYGDVLARVAAIPGVKSAGSTSDLPYTANGNTMALRIESQQTNAALGQDALFRLVSLDYLQTIGARLRQGRFLDERDRPGAVPAVVVNETLARQFWPDRSALGQRIDTGTGDGQVRWMTIVGVVADIRERGPDLALKPAVYVPFMQTEIGFFQPSEIAVLTTRDPLSLTKELQQAVWAVDSEQPVTSIRTMDAIVDDELASRAQVLRLLGAFAGLALLLASLGIYGVLSYVVSQRTREIGLRMAIGASQWDIVCSILGYSARITGTGLVIGIVAAIGATRLLATFLFGISPLDPRTFVVVSVVLAAVAFAASIVPTRRAASVDPMLALREE